MTPIAGLVAALAAGLLLRSPRQAMLAIIPPYLAVLAAQSWFLGSGRGNNPSSTIAGAGYWVVQAAALAFALGVSALLSARRTRRVDGGKRDAIANTRLASTTVGATLAAGLATLAIMQIGRPTTPQSGDTGPPVIGLVGMLGLLLTLVVLAVMEFTARRATAMTSSHGLPGRGRDPV
jgi:hypothetical protein